MLSFAEVIDELIAKQKRRKRFVDTIQVFINDMTNMIFTLYCLNVVGFNFKINQHPFGNDLVIGPNTYTEQELAFKGLLYFLDKNNIEYENAHIVYVGKNYELYKLGGATETVTQPGARNYSRILDLADLIITNHEINCYSVHVPVIDLKGLCINTRWRDVAVQRYGELIAIGALLVSENL